MSRRFAVLPVIATALAAAASAQAATLAGDKACYQESEPVNVVGTGFTPNGVVNFSRDNQAIGPLTADPTGTVRGGGPAPRITPSRERKFVLEARDAANPSIFATINPLATVFDVTVKPQGGNPARKRRISARGFTEGKSLYVHVRRGGKGKNIKLGKLKRPCGTKKLRKRIFKRKAKTGIYTVQFDTRRKYTNKAFPKVTFRVTIFPVSRASLASAAFATGERWVRVR